MKTRALRSKVSALHVNTGPESLPPPPPPQPPPPKLEKKNALHLVFSSWNNNSSAVFLLIRLGTFTSAGILHTTMANAIQISLAVGGKGGGYPSTDQQRVFKQNAGLPATLATLSASWLLAPLERLGFLCLPPPEAERMLRRCTSVALKKATMKGCLF